MVVASLDSASRRLGRRAIPYADKNTEQTMPSASSTSPAGSDHLADNGPAANSVSHLDLARQVAQEARESHSPGLDYLDEESYGAYDENIENFDYEALGIDPKAPTLARPGSQEKVDVLRARYEAGLPLWHNSDRYDHAQGHSTSGLLASLGAAFGNQVAAE